MGDKCDWYDKHNKISGCTEFTDRNDCSKSLSHRNKLSVKSRRIGNMNEPNLWKFI